jgi:hypothetical protein
MGKLISQRAFARTAGVSAAAVRHALTVGRLVQDDSLCLDLEDGSNALFLEEHQEKAVATMEVTGEVLPGWAAMSVQIPDRRSPSAICFLPPYGGGSFPSSTDTFNDWTFDDEKWAAFDSNGKQYKMTLVYDKNARPPWLEKSTKTAHSRRTARRKAARARA